MLVIKGVKTRRPKTIIQKGSKRFDFKGVNKITTKNDMYKTV